MTAITKGTAMKDKKKRAGGGGGGPPPPAGAYPTSNAPFELGVVSITETVQGGGFPPFINQTMATVFVRDTSLIDPNTGQQSFAQATNGAGANINSQTQAEIVVADYIATVLQSITPPTNQANTGFTHLNSVLMQPGTIYVSTNNFQEMVGIRYMLSGYNQNGAYNGGHPSATANASVVTNQASIPVTFPGPGGGTGAFNVNGNPMQSSTGIVLFDTTTVSSQSEVIMEFTITGAAKGQPTLTTATTNPTSGSSTFVGSCYMKIVFIA